MSSRIIIRLLGLTLGLIWARHDLGAIESQRPRLIVLTDIGHDPDDEQQITHLLVCANAVEIEGLIAVTGRFFRPNPTETVKDLRPYLIHHLIDGYGLVYPILKHHAPHYPAPDALHGLVARGQTGNGVADTGRGKSSAGSRLIVAAATRPDPRPLHLAINAGANTLAQALHDYRADHSPEELKAIIGRLRVYDNGGQDDAGAWICREFPDLHYVRSVTQTRGFGGPSNTNLGPHCWKPYPYSPHGQDAWMEENVRTRHGALGTRYPARRVGATVHYVAGGGTIPWIGLTVRGLTDPSEPSWGGWSGRYTPERRPNVASLYRIVQTDETTFRPYAAYADGGGVKDRWTDLADGKTYEDENAPVWRWRQAMWNDLRARLDWCVQPYDKANHHPVAVINGDQTGAILRFSAKPGDTLKFDASGSSDPDRDALDFSWWFYPEAGRRPYGKMFPIENAAAPAISVTIPADAAGKELHLILELTDQHPHVPLVAYRRAVITVAP